MVNGIVMAGQQPYEWTEAIRRSDIPALQHLISPDVDVNASTKRGKTALMLAAGKGEIPLIDRLIALGADVNRRNHGGGTALMYAAQYGKMQAAKRLIAEGAKVNLQGMKGWSAIMIAVLKGQEPMVELLLAHGADPNVRDMLGWTPLMRAAHRGGAGLVRRLLDSPDVDVNAQNQFGTTALHIAAATGSLRNAKLLVEHGATLELEDSVGNTALTLAEQNKHKAVADLLNR